ncbi:MAG: hypothetical protein AAF849_22330 [Bacteroidota bacterium]
MKTIIQTFCVIVSVLSLIFFLYGSIKLYRIESGNTFQNIESGIPGVEIVQPSNLLTREDVQAIIAVSVAGLVIGIGGTVISSNMKDTIPKTGTPKPDPKPPIEPKPDKDEESKNTPLTDTKPEQNQEVNEQPTEKTSVESETESSTENQKEENQEVNEQPTENTSDTEEEKSNDSPENS